MIQQKITRRRFVRDASVTFAGSSLYLNTFAVRSVLGTGPGTAGVQKPPNVQYRRLGKTGLQVSALSFGVMRLNEPAVLFKALDMGINYFDTAHVYQNGNNEKMLGDVLKQFGRQNVYIATKIPPFRRELKKKVLEDTTTMEQKMDESLRRLKTDYVDVLFLHAVSEPEWPSHETLIEFCRKMKKKGKARFVGISFHEAGDAYVEIVNRALLTGFYDVFLATINYKSPPEHIDALKRAHKNNIGIVAMKTQAGGYTQGVTKVLNPHQAALRWVLDQPYIDCAVPGMVNLEQLAQNAGAVGKKTSWSDRKILQAYYDAVKDRLCLRCGACTSTCSSAVNISTINRCLMYWEGYGDFQLGRGTYQGLSSAENGRTCLSCFEPACKCSNGMNIAERMRYAHSVFA